MGLNRDPNKGPIKDPRGTPIQEMSILIVALLYLFHKTAVLYVVAASWISFSWIHYFVASS